MPNSPVYLFKNNKQFGPYEDSAVKQWLQSGQCSPNDLAWREGMTEWKPLGMLFPPSNSVDETVPIADSQENPMRARMHGILGILKASQPCVEDFHEEDGCRFEISTPFSKYDQRTWLKYEPTSDGEIVRMQLTHLLGTLDIKEGLDFDQLAKTTNQLLDLLKHNVPQFRGSSAYLGLEFRAGFHFVFLNAAPIFLTKWSDADIAEALGMQLFDLVMSLALVPPLPIRQFDEEKK